MKLFYNSLKKSVSANFVATFVAMVLLTGNAWSQVSTYSFSSSAGTYTPITGGTTLGAATTDDDVFGNLPIGFSFCYNGTSYTSFGVNSNGWISLGATTPVSSYSALSTGTTNNVIAGFNFDLQGEPTIGNLRYETVGTSPNRTLVVQWTNFDAWNSTTNTDNYNFQIRLNETSNTIEVVYGSYTVAAAFRGAQVGLRGATNADFNNREVSNGINTWATSNAGITNGAICEVNNTPLVPASGLTFTWTPPVSPATPTTMTFTGVTSTGMTVNWVDNSTNEGGFRVYRSLDNIVFTQVANITSTSVATTGTPYNYVAAGLFSNTLYYWRVEAYNAACGATFLTGQQATSPGTMCGTYTIGPTGAYTSLTAAVAAVQTNGVLCPLIFEFQAAYVSTVETFPITIPFLGSGPGTSITCRPEVGATNISLTSTAAQTIIMNGATYWTFDGRPGGAGTNRELTIENTSATGIALQYLNDAQNNGINYCVVRGVNTSTASGAVVFGNATSFGNSNNTFTNSNFTSGVTRITNLVYASNTTTNVLSTGNSFTNNNFFDFGGTTTASSAFTVTGGNSAWTISNNNFYQTSPRTFTGAVTHWAININSITANVGSFTINNNFIGGSTVGCAGAAWTDNGAIAHRFIAINVTATAGGANNVQGNLITNFSFTTASSITTGNGVWCAINSGGTGCSMNTGNVTPNIIGSATATGAIVTTVTASGGMTIAINNTASGTHNISNNIIGGFTCSSSSAITTSSFFGIQSNSGVATISGNTIGSLVTAQSIVNAASTGAAGGGITGISVSAFVSGTVISNNTIRNLHNNYAGTGTGQTRGIVVSSGSNTITGNNISTLTTLSNIVGSTTTASVLGISCQSASALGLQTIAGNTITNLANLSATGATTVNGILVTSATTTGNTYIVRENNISALGAPVTVGASVTNGIQIYGGTGRVYNNMIVLGLDALAAPLTQSKEYNGINKNTANRSTIMFNSVSIDGAGVAAGTANTYCMRRIASPAAAPADSVYNNIFSNTRSNGASTGVHYSISLNANTFFNADGNVYYGNGTGYIMGQIGATPYASLTLWLSGVPGQELNSFAVAPNFVSATNLHINNALVSVLESRAQAVGNINLDIDNQVRPGPTAVNGGGTAHDIGADEFDGIPVNVDIGIQTIVLPAASGCHSSCEIVRVRLRNYTGTALNMATNNVTINASTTGPNPQTFATLVITSGTIAPNGFLDTAVALCYNMSMVGVHVFNATASTPLDFVTSNNAMTPVSILIDGGVATAARPSVCFGDSSLVTLSNFTNGGTIQWQSSPDNITWTNIPGATTNPLNTGMLSDTMYFRAMVCGTYPSVSDTVRVPFVVPAVTVNDTICGSGTVNLSATGSGTLTWYASPTGGSVLATGPTYSPAVSVTDTFYVQNSTGTPPTTQITTYAAGNGSAGNMFAITAINSITITSFDGHMTTGTATWEIWYRPNDYYLSIPASLSNVATSGWTLLGSAPGVVAAGLGVPTPLPIPVNITIPAGQTYSFYITTTGPTLNYTNGTAVNTPYAPASNVDFTFKQGYGGGYNNCTIQPRVWNGTIHYSSGCGSARTAAIAVVDPAPVVNVSSSNNICGNGSSTLIASSTNPAYNYTWTPAASLNTAVGDTVVASPTATTVYLVTGTDTATGCLDTASVTVLWALPPQVMATASPDTICSGSTSSLDAVSTFANPIMVGTTNNAPNTTTTYPAPYGNWYWGSRHQMLITAADLTAAGMVPGYLSSLSFEVTNIGTTQPLSSFEIKLGTTTASSLTAFYTGSMTSVFTAATYMPTVGLNTHTFSTLFFWDGVSDLIVETCHNNTTFTQNCVFRMNNTAYASTVYYRADAAGVCGNTAVTGNVSQRPNMRFTLSTGAWGYAWTPTASLSNPSISNPVATPATTTDYYLTVLDSISGCTTMDTVTVMVNPSPAPSFGPDTVICSNASLLLDGTAGPYTYLWQDSTVLQTFTVNAFGTYNVVVTDSLTGCTGTDTILVGINAAPSFTLGSDVTVCAGTQVSFSGPSGSYDYAWNTLDSTISITTGTAGSYDLAVTDQVNGCTSSDTVMLNVNPVPAVALGNDTSVCSASGSLTLTGPAGNYTYLWNTLDSTMSIAVNATGNYYVVVTDTATSCFAGDTIFVTYNISPIANLGNDTTFCSANGPLVLVGPAGNYSYLWSDMSTGNTLSVSASGNYYVDVLDTITGCTTSDSIAINVPMSPSFSLSDTALCGTQYVLNGPAGPYDYMWSTLDSTMSITVVTSGTYTLTVTDTTSGCTGSDASIVNINANPTVTASASSMTPCADDANVILTGSPAGGAFTGTSVSGNQFDPSIGGGSYTIVYNYTDVNGCSGSDSVMITVNPCVGIDEQFAFAGMAIYPNPNAGQFTFTALDQNCLEMTIEIVTVEGQVIMSNKYDNVQGNFTQEIDLNDFANGVYIMRVTTDGSVYTNRVIKQD
jgi:hypothetical protein